MLISTDERKSIALDGEASLRRLYDYNRHPGARDEIAPVLSALGYDDVRRGIAPSPELRGLEPPPETPFKHSE